MPSLCAAVVVLSVVAAVASAGVVSWNPVCTVYQSPGCWSSGGPPQPNDTVIFPAGTNVDFFGDGSGAPGYNPLFAGTLNISKGAAVRMTNNEFAVTGNIYVDGTLDLEGTVEDPGVGPIGAQTYPSIWESSNWEHGFWVGGFTPRFVQIFGVMVISGTVNFNSAPKYSWLMGYASLWSNVTIAAGGTLNITAGFVFGDIVNAGTFIAKEGSYITLPRKNLATGRMLIKDVYPVAYYVGGLSESNVLENHGFVQFTNGLVPTYLDGSITVNNHNSGTVIFNISSLNWAADTIINSGFVSLSVDGCDGSLHTPAFLNSIINSGTITVCAAALHTRSLVSNGGHFELLQGATVSTGSGSGAEAPRSFRYECDEQAEPLPVQTLLDARAEAGAECSAKNTSSCPKGLCCDAAGSCQKQQCSEMCCMSNDACTFVYSAANMYCPPAYGSSERPPALPRCQYKLSFDIREESAPSTTVHTKFVQNNALLKRFAFIGKNTIGGDSTGSFVSTEPVQLLGSVDVLRGAAWYLAVEFRQPATVGGGAITVHSGGRLVVGIDATSDPDGVIDVRSGGVMLVPRHAQFAIANMSSIRVAGRLHVDGELDVAAGFARKGRVFGEGIIREFSSQRS
jgi:hypothetical protein